MNVLKYLRDLVPLTGPSGAEEDVVRAVARLARPLADSVEVDAFGNLIVTRQGNSERARRVVLAAHMDAVGFRVRTILPDGFLRFEKVGGTDNRVMLGQRVWVRTDQNRLLGVIGTKSLHLTRETERTEAPAHTEQYIDIGARTAEDAIAMGVHIGDPVGFVTDLLELGRGSGRYTAHAIDDRAGCAILLALLEELRAESLPVTLTALFTVQEEVGLRGAQAAIQGLDVDLALAVDMTAADDTPDTGTNHLLLGHGPAIKIMDFSTQAHPAVRRGLQTAAERSGKNVQYEILTGIGTDAGALQFGGKGISTGTLSVPNRYTHSPVEVVDLQDLEGAVHLIREFLGIASEMNLRFVEL